MALLAGKLYDPATAVTKATTAATAMTAFDTTNLRLTFTAPSNGTVIARVQCVMHGNTTAAQVLFGVLDGSTVRGRVSPSGGFKGTALATTQVALEGVMVIGGLTPSSSYTFDAAYAVETAANSSGLKYGGPNNTTTNDAFGGIAFEIWSTA